MAKPTTLRELVNWVPPDYTMVAGLPSLASLSRPAYRGLSRRRWSRRCPSKTRARHLTQPRWDPVYLAGPRKLIHSL